MTLAALCIITDVTEIILFARRKLKPLTYLIFQLVKTPIWFGLFLDVLVRGIIAQRQEDLAGGTLSINYTLDAIIFGVLLYAWLQSSVDNLQLLTSTASSSSDPSSMAAYSITATDGISGRQSKPRTLHKTHTIVGPLAKMA